MSGRPTENCSMASVIKLVKYKGNGTQDESAWFVIFVSMCKISGFT
jgi:hypothetical protein